MNFSSSSSSFFFFGLSNVSAKILPIPVKKVDLNYDEAYKIWNLTHSCFCKNCFPDWQPCVCFSAASWRLWAACFKLMHDSNSLIVWVRLCCRSSIRSKTTPESKTCKSHKYDSLRLGWISWFDKWAHSTKAGKMFTTFVHQQQLKPNILLRGAKI